MKARTPGLVFRSPKPMPNAYVHRVVSMETSQGVGTQYFGSGSADRRIPNL